MLLTIMRTIAEDQREKISKGLSMHLVSLAFNEMTASKVPRRAVTLTPPLHRRARNVRCSHACAAPWTSCARSQDVKPEWQTAAANLLVTLGATYGKEVLDYLVKKVEAGVMPHYFVIKTLGDLAAANRTRARARARASGRAGHRRHGCGQVAHARHHAGAWGC